MGLETNSTVVAAAIVLGAIFLFLLIGPLVMRIQRFRAELRYINMELQRSGVHSRPLWRKRRRRLWLWLFFLSRK